MLISPFLLSSETKIPLWRWQRMMIFMLANTIGCIVTSVVLNIVDHRQVRHPFELACEFSQVHQTVAISLSRCARFVDTRFSTGWNSEQDNQEVRAARERLGPRAPQPGRGGAKRGE